MNTKRLKIINSDYMYALVYSLIFLILVYHKTLGSDGAEVDWLVNN